MLNAPAPLLHVNLTYSVYISGHYISAARKSIAVFHGKHNFWSTSDATVIPAVAYFRKRSRNSKVKICCYMSDLRIIALPPDFKCKSMSTPTLAISYVFYEILWNYSRAFTQFLVAISETSLTFLGPFAARVAVMDKIRTLLPVHIFPSNISPRFLS